MALLVHTHEKRMHRRLPAADLNVQLKLKQGLFSTWIDLSILDFTPYGIAITLPSEPELGAKITLRLILKMDVGDIRVNNLEAKVVNKLNNTGSNSWRVGVIFNRQTKQSTESTKQLIRIKQILEKSMALKERIISKAG